MSKESSGYLIDPNELKALALLQEYEERGGINQEMAKKIIPQLKGELREALAKIVKRNNTSQKNNP